MQCVKHVGRAILPADPLSSGSSRLEGGCGDDSPPHVIQYTKVSPMVPAPGPYPRGNKARAISPNPPTNNTSITNVWNSVAGWK